MVLRAELVVSLETVVDAGLIGEEDGSDAGGGDGWTSGWRWR